VCLPLGEPSITTSIDRSEAANVKHPEEVEQITSTVLGVGEETTETTILGNVRMRPFLAILSE